MASVAETVDPLLFNAAVFLGAAVVAVPLFRRLNLGPVLGYLAAGVAIGPHVLGLFNDVDAVLHFAEFGVVLLLFVIGLELRPSRLWRLSGEIFGLGLLQVLLSGAVIALALALAGFGTAAAVAAAGGFALSSTAFVVQILRDRGELNRPHGARTFAILLFQDLAIVPLLALIAVIAPHGEGMGGWVEGATAAAALAAVVLVGRYGLRPIFRVIAATGADEIFTATALLIVIAAALAMQAVGLSMAMGAFLAGVLLAESEYRHQLEMDIEPFRGLLLGLFFIGVGMSVDWSMVIAQWPLVLGGALALYAAKFAVVWGLTRAFRSGPVDAVRIAALLGQGGEFAFVVFSVGRQSGLWTLETQSLFAAVVTVSLAMTPLAVAAASRFGAGREALPDMTGVEGIDGTRPASVIVVGFGRFGQVVARVLRLKGLDVTLIDNDPRRIQMAETFGNKVFFGDLRRGDILRAAGAAEAKAIFLCVDDPDVVAASVDALRHRYPETLIFARGQDRFSEIELTKRGADAVVREMFGSSVELARIGLERLGEGEGIDEAIEEFRRRDAELLRLQSEFGALEGYNKMRATYSLKDDRPR